MIIGCPKEVKIKEHRVGLVPATVKALLDLGHKVVVQKNAGIGSGINDSEYISLGARILDSAEEVWKIADMVVKVKEPLSEEYPLMKKNQILFTFLHLAAEPELTAALLERSISSVAYETVQVGSALPLLKPMSEVAGKMSVQVGAQCLEKHQGGAGILLGGVTGVKRAKVSIIGGGIVGTSAAKVAVGMGADVTILDNNIERLVYLDDIFRGSVQTLFSSSHNVERSVVDADLTIGAVLVAGARAPHLISREIVKRVRDGSVMVDVAVDQGGCVETMRATTHSNPTFIVDGVIHYGVSNMPGAVSRTSTFALTNATLPYIIQLAELGLEKACSLNNAILMGLNTYRGNITYKAVADAHNLKYVPAASFIK